jgi:hypothetical protein
MPYTRPDYKIPWWRAVRWETFTRAGGTCEVCFNEPATQTHHLRYPTQRREQASDLLAVCDSCHYNLHHPEAANDNWPDDQGKLPLTGTDDC